MINYEEKLMDLITEMVTLAGPSGIRSQDLMKRLQGLMGVNRWDLKTHENVIALLVKSGRILRTGNNDVLRAGS